MTDQEIYELIRELIGDIKDRTEALNNKLTVLREVVAQLKRQEARAVSGEKPAEPGPMTVVVKDYVAFLDNIGPGTPPFTGR